MNIKPILQLREGSIEAVERVRTKRKAYERVIALIQQEVAGRTPARLAVLRYLGTGVQGVPLLLDDPLTGTDDDRFVAVMEFLLGHVLSERPVLLLSCHGWRHERLLATLPPELRGLLTVVSLSGGAAEGPD